MYFFFLSSISLAIIYGPIQYRTAFHIITYICSELYQKAINKKIPNCIKIKFLLLYAVVSIFISEYINKMQFYCKPIWFEFFPYIVYIYMWNIERQNHRQITLYNFGNVEGHPLWMWVRGGVACMEYQIKYITSSIRFLLSKVYIGGNICTR